MNLAKLLVQVIAALLIFDFDLAISILALWVVLH